VLNFNSRPGRLPAVFCVIGCGILTGILLLRLKSSKSDYPELANPIGVNLHRDTADAQGELNVTYSTPENRNLVKAIVLIQYRDMKGLTKLLKDDPCVATRRVYAAGIGALHAAARYDNVAAAEMLLSAGAEINDRDPESLRQTPLHTAAHADSVNVLRLLLERGSDINALGEGPIINGETIVEMPYVSPLDLASEYGCERAAMLLLERGAKLDVNSKEHSFSALHHAMKGSYSQPSYRAVKSLITSDPLPNVSMGNRVVIELLLKNGDDLAGLDFLGSTPVHVGIRKLAIESVEYLLNNYGEKIDLNLPGEYGFTPLQLAVSRQSLENESKVKAMIELLIRHGADIDGYGGPFIPAKTAYEVACEMKWGGSILDLLRPSEIGNISIR
jgi:ankyrin repeat protein